ncbi:hypothetical protein GH714_017858 [Hevea brasiliensis]|uniref:Uncharacterized protein n=1 Tax=Hevea brasiliensis TaxID=3981 RepID=A0A6A6N2Z0_HEVBR|nr:hypothetical protein GH714_017858 [Hevea brasiliensis]
MDIATTIGGAILSPVVKALFEQLASQDLLKGAADDEEEPEGDDVDKQAQGLGFDAEDILDEFHIEARRRS